MNVESTADDILVMKDISKIYPNGVMANRHVNFSVRAGEIHALVGENGAGKSTLMKILFGIEQPTEGTILYNGNELHIKSPLDAIRHGFGMVHQHFMLVESMSVAENICLGMEPGKGPLLREKLMNEQAQKIINQYHFVIDPKEKIKNLPIGTRQKVEILKALYKGARILILDEPTAVLTPQETEELFVELKELRNSGCTIIFISHKLNEVKEICERITVLRNGTSVGVYSAGEISEKEISNLMVGKNIHWEIEKQPSVPGETVLKLRDVCMHDDAGRPILKHVSFDLPARKILGIVGVEGNGQKELIDTITGLQRCTEGSVMLNGKDITSRSIAAIRKEGISYIPQDRIKVGTAVTASIQENLFAVFTEDERFVHKGILKKNEIRQWADTLINQFMIKTKSADVPVKMLSGGNMQKVIIAREFSTSAGCIIADQPTRGVDIGAAKFIHQKIIEMRDNGAAILVNSADLAEILEISDSLVVMYGGEITAYFPDAGMVSETELGEYMLGLKKQGTHELAGCLR